MKKIESLQNQLIKHLIQLQAKSKTRKQTQTFLIEGLREISLALKGGYRLNTILFCADILSEREIRTIVSGDTECIEISAEVYKKLAYRDTTEGVLAVAQIKSLALSDLKLSDNPLIIVAEGIEKPGNLGAILRTADAANLDAVLIANPKSDMYNPNVVRASVGCLFTTTIGVGTTAEIAAYLKQNNINIYCATLQEAVGYHTLDYTKPTALVVGTEATGVTDEFRALADQNIIIPMQGVIDSMNVSVAASVLIFEAKRQRDFV
ncbi:MAG TPA: RNA methyltransferase [Flavobacterium sp.]|nr:RNA methyltransferase [Flavobacterium sp.]